MFVSRETTVIVTFANKINVNNNHISIRYRSTTDVHIPYLILNVVKGKP